MITHKFQIILGVLIILAFLFIVNMVRKRALELKYALSWFIMLIGLGVLVCIPKTMNVLAKAMGIYSPVNMIFFVGFILAIIIIFVLTVTLSRLSARVRKMAQIVAMMNTYQGEDLREEQHGSVSAVQDGRAVLETSGVPEQQAGVEGFAKEAKQARGASASAKAAGKKRNQKR